MTDQTTDPMFALAKRFPEFRVHCWVGDSVSCTGQGQVVKVAWPAVKKFAGGWYPNRGKCPVCPRMIGLTRDNKIRRHMTTSHESCCQGRGWKLIPDSARLGALLNCMAAQDGWEWNMYYSASSGGWSIALHVSDGYKSGWHEKLADAIVDVLNQVWDIETTPHQD